MLEIEAVSGVLNADLNRFVAQDHVDGDGLVSVTDSIGHKFAKDQFMCGEVRRTMALGEKLPKLPPPRARRVVVPPLQIPTLGALLGQRLDNAR